MKYRNLGKSGLKVSELSFGSWVTFNKQVDTNLAESMFGTCLDAGINFFDNAEAYNDGLAETVMGKVLKRLEYEYPLPRSHVVISTKIFFGTTRGRARNNWIPKIRSPFFVTPKSKHIPN